MLRINPNRSGRPFPAESDPGGETGDSGCLRNGHPAMVAISQRHPTVSGGLPRWADSGWRRGFGAVLASLLAAWSAPALADAADARPDIIYVVVDDLGYGDCGFQGGRDIPTPHIDALARSGVVCSNAYATGAVCSPSRASLLTARYPSRDGVQDWIRPAGPGMAVAVPTIPSYLRTVGYRTALVGKWHLGERPAEHPIARGFDVFFGFLGGGRSYWPDPPGRPVRGGNAVLRGDQPAVVGTYMTRALADEAVGFLRGRRPEEGPCFLMLAFNAVHTPMEAESGTLERFSSMTDRGRATYAAMLTAVDDAVGAVVAAVRERGAEDRTLIVFTSDNGGPIVRNSPNHSSNGPLRGGKGETWEGGIRVPLVLSWPGRLAPGRYDRPVSHLDLGVTALSLARATPHAAWPVDGVDLLPRLSGTATTAPHDELCWSHGRQWAIRRGDLKLTCAAMERTSTRATVGLYDLAQDPGETNDLSASQPAVVADLRLRWEAWRRAVGAVDPATAGPIQSH